MTINNYEDSEITSVQLRKLRELHILDSALTKEEYMSILKVYEEVVNRLFFESLEFKTEDLDNESNKDNYIHR